MRSYTQAGGTRRYKSADDDRSVPSRLRAGTIRALRAWAGSLADEDRRRLGLYEGTTDDAIIQSLMISAGVPLPAPKENDRYSGGERMIERKVLEDRKEAAHA